MYQKKLYKQHIINESDSIRVFRPHEIKQCDTDLFKKNWNAVLILHILLSISF